MKVLVIDTIAPEGIAHLTERGFQVDQVSSKLERETLLARLGDYEGIVTRSSTAVTPEFLGRARRLRILGRAGVGVDNIDVDAATRAGIAVVNAPTANTLAAAEHTLALLLALARRVATADASVRRGEWRRGDFMGTELGGKTLGIVGLGRVGLAVADRARAFAMNLLGSDPLVSAEAAATYGVRLVDVDALLAESDVVTLHVPLVAGTRGLLDAARLGRMKRGALLVNVARGGVVDENALADALISGRLGGAAIDVFEHEPLADSPLLKAPNTVLTPHLGASTAEAQARASLEVVQGVVDVLAGRPATHRVNR